MLVTRPPEEDPSLVGPPVLPLHSKVTIAGARYQLVEVTGKQMVFRRHDHMHTLPMYWNQYCWYWKHHELTVERKVLKSANKLRLANTPFEFFDLKTQQFIERKHYYCVELDAALQLAQSARMAGLELPPGAVRCLSKEDIKDWLKDLNPYQNGSKKPSRGQVMRDYALWVASGRNKCVLAHGNKGSSRKSIFDEILVDIINDVIETYWGPNPNLSLENIQAKIADEVGLRFADGELEVETIPSLATIARYQKKLNNYLLVELREGIYEADRQHQPKGKVLIPDFPHSRWEVDHSLLPIRVAFEFKDENGETKRIIVGKVWITVIIDAATRFVLAAVLGIDGPNSLRTMKALKMAMSPKFELFAELGIENACDVSMIPVMLVMDNGKDFHSKDVSALLSDLLITQQFAGVYRGDHKPFVERFFRTLKAYLRKIRGAEAKDAASKKGPKTKESNPAKPLTLKELEHFIWHFIMDVYHIRPHAGLRRQTPLMAMTSGLRRLDAERSRGYSPPLRFFSDYTALEWKLMFSIRRTLTYYRTKGVRFENLFYNGGLDAVEDGTKLPSRFDFEDLGQALVYHPGRNEYVFVDCTDTTYATGLDVTIHRKVWAHIVDHESKQALLEKRKPKPTLARYQANEHALLCQLFEITGHAKASSRSLRDGVVVLGRNLDLATAVARQEARAWHSGVKPPSALIDLVKGDSGYWEVDPKAPTPAQKRGEYDYVTLPPAEEELVDQTIDPSADFDPRATT
ncbi:DDE-type integrase/transposase/recombinase [Bradyrhizobium cosmicum]|uniref:DDE-type integrase/transposase/recombinase n=1 Tax=Bradyrhizobium cosmicum TaxID=1404864 RepID=UPI0011647F80|nr:DDE-type integrase/transposase/recombinase [Bradyrhizobium cosmicum]QDP26160.1 DDE-type integrase/transposase/recombinase [Bradyrhizobium cosmicum]